jgi:hypothetical protein
VTGDYFILITGARDWFDYDRIWNVIIEIDNACQERGEQLNVITGAQRKEEDNFGEGIIFVGADWLAIEVCVDLQIPFHGYPAQWNRARKQYGKNWRREGVDRNARMLRIHQGQVREGHAFHNNLAASKGTKDMVSRLEKALIPVTLHSDAGSVLLNAER